MIFRQVTHDDLGCASYLVGDHEARVAAVVDPRFDIDEYLRLARYFGVRIEHVLETHNHADHVSGHGRLAAATGATIHVHSAAGAVYDHEPFDDGWELALGSVRVRAIHTPGHRPEHTAFALIDLARGEEPWALLTGDTLFVGDVARPDLAVDRREGARDIFRSLHERLLTLPAGTEVWPGHLGGSLCGGPGMDMKVSSTIGYEREHNHLLAETDEERFVERATATLPPQPPNFEAIVDLNRGPAITAAVELCPMRPRDIEDRQAAGALIVDVRADEAFDEAHIPGSVCVPVESSGFGTKLAWITDRDRELVLVADDDETAHHAARLAAAVGIQNLAGFLVGGVASWRADGRAVEAIERVSLRDLPERRAGDPRLQILDVREDHEWRDAHIPGSVHRPYHDLHDLPEEIDPEGPVAAICAAGPRSAVAASLLKRAGVGRVIHVVEGGVPKWEELGQPVER